MHPGIGLETMVCGVKDALVSDSNLSCDVVRKRLLDGEVSMAHGQANQVARLNARSDRLDRSVIEGLPMGSSGIELVEDRLLPRLITEPSVTICFRNNCNMF